jgi:hypothetical protein
MLSGKSLARSRPTALGSMLQASTYGATIPTIFGRAKSPLLVTWAANLRTGASSKKSKKKGVTTYVEAIDFLIGSNPVQGLLQFWGNNNSRFPLDFLTYSTTLSGASTITIPDANFYFLIGVTVETSLTGSFNDYGAQGSSSYTSFVSEYPLWNSSLHGPDLVDASGSRWWPFVYKWVPGDGAVVTLPFIVSFGAPSWGIPNGNGNIHFYYAALSALNKRIVPATSFRLTFESQLGNNNAAYAGFSGQQIIYPFYAGASSPNFDLGAMGMIQDTRVEVMGSHTLYKTGDADFFDMIEDVLKSGMLQVGAQLGQVHRGVNLNDLPGPIQKNLFAQLEPMSPTVTYRQPNAAGNILIGICSWRPNVGGSAPTISSTNTDGWTPIYATAAALQAGMWYATAVGGPNNAVHFVYNGSFFAYDDRPFILEMDSASTVVDATNTASGTTSGGPNTISCSITTNGPAYIVATFDMTQGFISGLPGPADHWANLFPQDNSQSGVFGRYVATAGTYTINLKVTNSTPWIIGMIALKNAQTAPSYAKTLGNILDAATTANARLGCRANGLYGSLSMNAQKKAADWLTELYECANTWPVWSGFRLKSIFRSEVSAVGNGAVYISPTAAGPILDITESMLIGDKAGPLITVEDKTPGIDANNILQIEFLDRNGDYNPSVAAWPEQLGVSIFGPRKDSPQVLHEICDPLIARKLAAIQARRNTYVVPKTFKFHGKANLQTLEAGDLVTINDQFLGITKLPVRLSSVAEDDKHELAFEAEPFYYGVHSPDSLTVTASSPFQPNNNADPGTVNTPIIFEPVPRLVGATTAQAQLWAVVSGANPNYGGNIVMLSTDGGTSYNPIGRIVGNAATGFTAADWPIATDPDTTNDLPVDLTESLGALLSYQVADEDNFVFPCYVAGGNAAIPYGLMTYAVATLTSANHYTLKATAGNKLRRCVFGAPALVTDVDHPNASRWAFLNPSGAGIFKINLDPLWIGKTLHFKFLAFNTFQNAQQALAAATDYTFAPTGTPGGTTGGTVGSNNQYTLTGGALTNPTTTTIAMAQAVAQFASGLRLNYNARTFTIAVPGAPTTYFVTIADPNLIGDTGTGTTLTATCQTSNALVGVAGNIYIGTIIALPAAGGVVVGPGGNPSSNILVNGS